MKVNFDTMMNAMSGISDRLITEAAPGSEELKNSAVRRITTAAATFVIICAGVVLALFSSGKIGVGPPIAGDTGADVFDTGSESTETVNAVIDESIFRITHIADAQSGAITSVSVDAPDGYTAEFSDTQGQYFEKMLLEITHGDEDFCVVCDIKTGEVDDFMRVGTHYSAAWMDADLEWNHISEYTDTVTWRYDKTGVTFIAVGVRSTKEGTVFSNTFGLWAYDPRVGTVYLADQKYPSLYNRMSLSIIQRSVPLPDEKDSDGSFAVLWELSPEERDPMPGDPDPSYMLVAYEASSSFPDLKLDSEYKLSIPDPIDSDIVHVTFGVGNKKARQTVELLTGRTLTGDDIPPDKPTEGTTAFDIAGNTVSVSWKRGEDGVTKILSVIDDASGRGDVCESLYAETRGKNVLLSYTDGRIPHENYYLCDLETGKVTDLYEDCFSGIMQYPKREDAAFIHIKDGSRSYFLKTDKAPESESRALLAIYRFDNNNGWLDFDNCSGRFLYLACTDGGTNFIWEEAAEGHIDGAWTLESFFRYENEHEVICDLSKIIVDGEQFSASSPALRRSTVFHLGTETVTFAWSRSDKGDINAVSYNENVKLRALVNLSTYLVEVGGSEWYLCDMRSGRSYSGLERMFSAIDIDPTKGYNIILPDKWYETMSADPLVIQTNNRVGNLKDDLNMPLIYVFMIPNEALFGPGVPDEGMFEDYKLDDYIIPLHPLLIESIHDKYPEYEGMSWRAVCTEEKDMYGRYDHSNIIINVTLGKTIDEVISGADDLLNLRFLYNTTVREPDSLAEITD